MLENLFFYFKYISSLFVKTFTKNITKYIILKFLLVGTQALILIILSRKLDLLEFGKIFPTMFSFLGELLQLVKKIIKITDKINSFCMIFYFNNEQYKHSILELIYLSSIITFFFHSLIIKPLYCNTFYIYLYIASKILTCIFFCIY